MVTNEDLENLGLNDNEKRLYWERLTSESTLSKVHIERSELKTVFADALTDLNNIINKDGYME